MAGVRLEFAQFGHFDYFNIYRNSVSTAIENLEQPIGTLSTMYYEDLTTEPNNDYYYRIGVIRDSIEEFSEEIHVRTEVVFDPPYNLTVEFKNDEANRLELNWKLDGFVDEQHYYCSETPIDSENLPAPKVILDGEARSYIDTDVEVGKTYYVRVGSSKNGILKISDEVKCYAFNSNLFAINSDFENLADKTGKFWTAHGHANISNGWLNLDGTDDYLTTAFSDDYYFANSEDVTIRFILNLRSIKSSGVACIFSAFQLVNNSTDYGYDVRVTNTQILVVMWTAQNAAFNYVIPKNQDVEISLERKNMVWRLYVSSSQVGGTVTQTSNYLKPTQNPAYLGSGIGEGYGNQRDVDGSIRNFQIIKGLAVGGGQTTSPRI